MNVKLTLWGCADYLAHKSEVDRDLTKQSLQRTFSTAINQVSKNKSLTGLADVEVVPRLEHIPRLNTYILDVEIEVPGSEKTAETFHDDTTKRFGDLWAEFVRTFISPSALVATCVVIGETRKISTPHPQCIDP